MKLLSWMYKWYKYKVYYRINHIRGSTLIAEYLNKISRRGIEKIDSEPESVFDKEEWDNLIILDACRHDLYQRVVGRKVPKRISLGSHSKEYIRETYSKGDFSDVVYITANPYFHNRFFEELTGRPREEVFHTVYPVYETDWDENNSTVMPESMVKKAISARKLFPEKKIIVHFMQPHYPFIGSNLATGSFDNVFKEKNEESEWVLAEKGELEREKVESAYNSNLEYVLTYVNKLVNELDGKSIITADHGNLVGENGRYGHPDKSNAKVLREVPWDVR